MADKEKAPKDPVATASLWGTIAGSVTSLASSGVQLTGMLNKDVRENNLAIAEANARAAEANAQAAGSGSNGQLFGIDKKHLLIGGGILLLLILAIVFMKKS